MPPLRPVPRLTRQLTATLGRYSARHLSSSSSRAASSCARTMRGHGRAQGELLALSHVELSDGLLPTSKPAEQQAWPIDRRVAIFSLSLTSLRGGPVFDPTNVANGAEQGPRSDNQYDDRHWTGMSHPSASQGSKKSDVWWQSDLLGQPFPGIGLDARARSSVRTDAKTKQETDDLLRLSHAPLHDGRQASSRSLPSGSSALPAPAKEGGDDAASPISSRQNGKISIRRKRQVLEYLSGQAGGHYAKPARSFLVRGQGAEARGRIFGCARVRTSLFDPCVSPERWERAGWTVPSPRLPLGSPRVDVRWDWESSLDATREGLLADSLRVVAQMEDEVQRLRLDLARLAAVTKRVHASSEAQPSTIYEPHLDTETWRDTMLACRTLLAHVLGRSTTLSQASTLARLLSLSSLKVQRPRPSTTDALELSSSSSTTTSQPHDIYANAALALGACATVSRALHTKLPNELVSIHEFWGMGGLLVYCIVLHRHLAAIWSSRSVQEKAVDGHARRQGKTEKAGGKNEAE